MRHYDRRRPHFQVRFEDGSVVEDGYFAICCNTDPYTYLGTRPLHLAPDTTLDDPLTMVTVRSLKLRRLGRLAGSALFSGSKLRHSRHVDYRPGVRGVTVSSDRPFPYQVDGDFLGRVRSLEFRYEPDAIRLIVP